MMPFAMDAVMLAAAGLAGELASPRHAVPVFWTIVFSVLAVAFLYARDMYKPPHRVQLIELTRAVVTACALAAVIAISLRIVLTNPSFVAGQSARMWLFATAFLAAGRISLAIFERRARRAGHPTLIVGAGNVGRLVAMRLLEHPEMGLRPVGFLDKEPLYSSDETLGVPVLGASWDLERIVQQNNIQHVVVAFSTAPTEILLRMLKRCEQLGVRTSFVPRLYEKATERFTIERLGGLPLISSYSPDPKGWQFAVKYAVDRAAAALALVLLSPLLGALALTVYITSGRPIFYRAERIGRDGKRFNMLKFRTMHPRLESERFELVVRSDTGTSGAEEAARLTRLGVFMRRRSLDELPQLFNILKGEMSFIGPRPERTEYVQVLEHEVYRYGERHRVKSGITGWAQVSGLRGQTSLADRIEWDNYYIENWSFWFDFKILLLTVVAVFRPGEFE